MARLVARSHSRVKSNSKGQNYKKKVFMKLHSLQNLYVEELRDLYDAENQLIKALPKFIKAARSEKLKEAINEHLEETRGHLDRLDEIFNELDHTPKGKTCKGMKGAIDEAQELIKQADETVLDAALISAIQKMEHYEIAGYGCVRSYANLLGSSEVANLLQETLDEESQVDNKLTQLAEEVVNIHAAEVEVEIKK